MPNRKPKPSLLHNPLRTKKGEPVPSRIRFKVLKSKEELAKIRALRGEISGTWKGHGISVKVLRSKRGKRHIAFIDDNVFPIQHFHEFEHARQLVFHHEKKFPLNPHSFLAQLEEIFFVELFYDHLPLSTKTHAHESIDRLKISTLNQFYKAIIGIFPRSKKERIRIIVMLYSSPKIKPSLEVLNQKMNWADALENQKIKVELQMALKQVVNFIVEAKMGLARKKI